MKDWVYRKVSKKLPNASKVEKSFNKKTKGQKAKAANITQILNISKQTNGELS